MPRDAIPTYVAMVYRVSKQKSTGYSPYFLLYGRKPLFPSSIQHIDGQIIDYENTTIRNFQLELKNRGLREVMPLAMRNLAIAQQRDKERYRHVRGGKYDRPKAKFVVGDFVMVKQKKDHTLQPSVRPHILRIVEMRESGVVILQGSDAATIGHKVPQIARCTVPISDTKLYPERYVRTLAVHCKICGSRNKEALMLLCDVCNMGYNTFSLPVPLDRVPDIRWRCEVHR